MRGVAQRGTLLRAGAVCGSASDAHMCECVFLGKYFGPAQQKHTIRKNTSAKLRQKITKKGETLAALMKIYSAPSDARPVFCSFQFWAAGRF